jgi:hypothetical protein
VPKNAKTSESGLPLGRDESTLEHAGDPPLSTMVRFEKQDRSPVSSLLALECDPAHFARKLGVSKQQAEMLNC